MAANQQTPTRPCALLTRPAVDIEFYIQTSALSFVEGSAPNGHGEDHYYWRSLVLAREDPEQAHRDIDFAHNMGVAS